MDFSRRLIIVAFATCFMLAMVEADCYGFGNYGRKLSGYSKVGTFCGEHRQAGFSVGETRSGFEEPNNDVCWNFVARNNCAGAIRDFPQCQSTFNEIIGSCDGTCMYTRGGNIVKQVGNVDCIEYVVYPSRGPCYTK